jgi:hypothetical protein
MIRDLYNSEHNSYAPGGYVRTKTGLLDPSAGTYTAPAYYTPGGGIASQVYTPNEKEEKRELKLLGEELPKVEVKPYVVSSDKTVTVNNTPLITKQYVPARTDVHLTDETQKAATNGNRFSQMSLKELADKDAQ